MNVTYGQLGDALIVLGFERVESENMLVFRDRVHDAVFVLPIVPSNEPVRPAHLIAARHTVIGKGVADPIGFDAALESASMTDRSLAKV
jgi:hypothetical protein